jgi:hypothetical protein
MTHAQYIELYEKYQPYFNKLVEIYTASSTLGQRSYKKFLLIDIKGLMTREEGGRDIVSTTSVIVKDLEYSQQHAIPLQLFDQAVRLINLSNPTILQLSNNNKTGHLLVDSSLGYIEFFIIQINSHFGKTPVEWSKVAGNLSVVFNSKRTNNNPVIITDKLYLASLITNQYQPVFHLLRTYPLGQPNFNSETDYFDTVEVTLDELSPINEDYEVTFIYEKKP